MKKNPARSAAQYRLAEAVLHGIRTGPPALFGRMEKGKSCAAEYHGRRVLGYVANLFSRGIKKNQPLPQARVDTSERTHIIAITQAYLPVAIYNPAEHKRRIPAPKRKMGRTDRQSKSSTDHVVRKSVALDMIHEFGCRHHSPSIASDFRRINRPEVLACR